MNDPRPQAPEARARLERGQTLHGRRRATRLRCCGRFAVQVHHCIHGRYSQTKASDFDTIPLCDRCHRELHMCSKDTWRHRFGWYDYEKIPDTRAAVARIRSNARQEWEVGR